jgi:hypothetical protein
MGPSMHCSFVLPDLLWPGTPAVDPYHDLRLPALETLLARGALTVAPPTGLEAHLCALFGVPKQQDWPVAPLTGRYDGVDTSQHYWLRCDPVHLEIQGLRLIVHEPAAVNVPADEAQSLAARLNEHFAAEDIELLTPKPERWYVRLKQPPRLTTTPLAHVAGRDAGANLPNGADGLNFQRLLTEAQMIMHAHPVNAAREARGDVPINGVWMWGGGTAPASVDTALNQVWSNDVLTQALAGAAGVAHAASPDSFSAWLAARSTAPRQLVLLDALSAAVRTGDVAAWRESLGALERAWFGPLLAAVRSGAITTLQVIAINSTATWSLTVTLRQLQRWWRRRKPLAIYAPAG